MRIRNALLSTLLLVPAAGCAGQLGHMPPVGGLYAGAKGMAPNSVAEVSDGARPGPKSGESCAMGVLGLASWGDMSLAAAKKSAGISKVDTLDYKTMDILGVVYQKHCLLVTGE